MSEAKVTSIQLDFTANTKGAEASIDSLISKLKSIQRAAQAAAKAMGDLGNAAWKSYAKQSKTSGGSSSKNALVPYSGGAVGPASKPSGRSDVIDAEWKEVPQETGEATRTATKSTADYNEVLAKLSAIANAAVKGIKAVGSAFKDMASAVGKVLAPLGKLALNIGLMPFKKMASAIGGVVTKFTQFFAAIKRIAVYRAIRTALKEIVQGLKEGMGNLYQYSKAIDGQFAKSMDMLATSALYAKNSLGAMAAPIINVLAPAVDYLTDRFVELLNKINETIASLTGATTWTRAIKYPVEYAEATDSATKSAKALKATLLGFDEINRLDDNSSGSGGSGAAGMDYSKMFEEMETSTNVSDWVQKVKDAWNNADFTDIGASIGQKLKDGLDSIPWETIKAKGRQVAKSLATLINGFVEVEGLGTSIGSTIAEALNFSIGNIYTFFDTVHWDSIGSFIADGINGFVKKFDVKQLGKAIASVINSAVTMINTFFKKVDWNAIGQFISDGINSFFDEINTREMGELVTNGITGAINMVKELLVQTDFDEVGRKIGEMFKAVDWIGILKALADVMLTAIKAALVTLKGLIAADPEFGTIVVMAIAAKLAAAFAGTTVIGLVANGLKSCLAAGATAAAAATAAGAGGLGVAISALAGAFCTALLAALTIALAAGLTYVLIQAANGADWETIFSHQEYSAPQNTHSGTINSDFRNMSQQERIYEQNRQRLIRGYASGGTPETGSLFLANENGPELVANIGRKTQVANNDQIMQSISAGVEVANMQQNQLLMEQNELLRKLLAKDIEVNTFVSTDSLISGLDRKNRRDGRAVVPIGG